MVKMREFGDVMTIEKFFNLRPHYELISILFIPTAFSGIYQCWYRINPENPSDGEG